MGGLENRLGGRKYKTWTPGPYFYWTWPSWTIGPWTESIKNGPRPHAWPPIFTTPKNTVTLELTRTWITLYSQSQIVFNIANFGISELLTTEHLSESLWVSTNHYIHVFILHAVSLNQGIIGCKLLGMVELR